MVFGCEGKDYLGILKLNYRTSYTHQTKTKEDGSNGNHIILQRALLPAQGQKLSEACVVDLSNGSILLTEKKYENQWGKTAVFF